MPAAPPRFDLPDRFAHIEERLSKLEQAVYTPNFPVAQLFRTTPVSVGAGAQVVVNWSGDNGSATEPFWFSTAPSGLFIPPARTGWWLLAATSHFDPTPVGGRFMATIFKNGVLDATGAVMQDNAYVTSPGHRPTTLSKITRLNAGDYLQLWVTNGSTNAINWGGQYEYQANFCAMFLRGI